jgi:cystathionine beta-synthase
MIQVEDKESFLMTRDLLVKEGLYSGISSGSAVVGAIKWIKDQGDRFKGKKVMIVLPDSGNRYLSKVYNEDWMREAGFLDTPSMGTVADLLHSLQKPQGGIIMAKTIDKVSSVISQMTSLGFSQLPVADSAGWIKGIVTEGNLLTSLYQGKLSPNDSIESLIESSIEFVSPADPIEKVSRLVTAGKTPIVSNSEKSGELLAIITKIDLITYLGKRI